MSGLGRVLAAGALSPLGGRAALALALLALAAGAGLAFALRSVTVAGLGCGAALGGATLADPRLVGPAIAGGVVLAGLSGLRERAAGRAVAASLVLTFPVAATVLGLLFSSWTLHRL